MVGVELQHVTKRYGRGPAAVDGVSLEVGEGEFLTLVGPSGCGKSTTLRLIAGLERPTAGTVRIRGEDARRRPPRARGVSLVFQEAALYPHLSVRANLAFPLRMRGVGRRESRRAAEEAAAVLGLAGLLDRRASRLSGGERRRVALGRAMVRKPAVYLLDEPLSDVDPARRADLRSALRAMREQRSAAFIMVTHDQEEALSLGDRVAVMHAGRLRQIGPPQQLFDEPADVIVARSVGSPPMNLLPGRLARDERGRLVFVHGDDGATDIIVLPESLPVAGAREAVLGVRATGLEAAREMGPAGAGGVRVTVEAVEPVGDHVRLVGRTRGGVVVTAMAGEAADARPGEMLSMHVHGGQVHLFNAGESGEAFRRPTSQHRARIGAD